MTASHPGGRSLDPENWSELRALGHRMLDDMFDDLAGIRDEPVWRPMLRSVREAWAQALPHDWGDGKEGTDGRRSPTPRLLRGVV